MTCFAMFSACAVYATTEELIGGMGTKFVRGVVNTFTGWIEFPVQIYKGYEKTSFPGALVGIFTGVWYGVGRTASGVIEMASFWAADPKDNDGVGIPLDAEYAWEEGTHHNPVDPNFMDATVAPMGNKLLRGAGQAIFGFVEVPGQILKGAREKAPDFGIIKGFWYWFSRDIDGIYDVCTFWLPNPRDTKGLAFDEKWPWSALGDNLK